MLSAEIISCISSAWDSQKSNTHEKSGSIINTVGKSVSFVTISSIWRVTHPIRKSGNAEILLFFTWIISSKFPDLTEEKSTLTSNWSSRDCPQISIKGLLNAFEFPKELGWDNCVNDFLKSSSNFSDFTHVFW